MALQPASAAISSPSPFSSLLRRSKFVSFDKKINQVYTTYKGDAHRGNWGFKRPLPLGRKKAYITVNAVDSHYQQTEWNGAEAQARFVRKWDELDVDIHCTGESLWQQKLDNRGQDWFVDSEFAPSVRDNEAAAETVSSDQPHPLGPRTTAVPNIHAMSDVEFERYLKRLRKLRPKFKHYMRQQAIHDPRVRDQSLYQLAQTRSDYHMQFLSAHGALPHHSLDSRVVEPIPHKSAGLVYTHISPLQTAFIGRKFPGIILHHAEDRPYSWKLMNSYVASFAGMVVSLPLPNTGIGEKPLIDLDSEHGVDKNKIKNSMTNLRLAKVPILSKVPEVVGRNKEGLKAADITMVVASDKQPEWRRSNPHRPGTREYVSMDDDAQPLEQRVRPMPLRMPLPYWARPVNEALKTKTPDSVTLYRELTRITSGRKDWGVV